MMVYYHGSNQQYDFPSMDIISAPTQDKPIKCALGYYVTTDRNFAASLGKYVYQITLKEQHVAENWELAQMRQMYDALSKLPHSSGVKAFSIKRRQFAYGAGVDIVHLVEHDGKVGESVIVNLQAIAQFQIVE